MHCPACDSTNTYVADTIKDTSGSIRRRRECKACGRRFSTIERIIDNTPLVVKRGGRREPFNRDKILSGREFYSRLKKAERLRKIFKFELSPGSVDN